MSRKPTGDLGPEDASDRERDLRTGLWKVPVLVAADRPVSDWLEPVAGQPGHFRSDGVGRDRDVEFVPFYRLHRRTYAVYWDLLTPDQWQREQAALEARQQQQRQLEAATVAYAQPGEMQPERELNYQAAEGAHVVRLEGRAGRRTAGWFSFDLPVDAAHPLALIVTYNSDQWQRRTFDIRVDGQRLASVDIERRGPLCFFDAEYPLPAELIDGKKQITLRFEATGDNETAAVYGIRVVRTDEVPIAK